MIWIKGLSQGWHTVEFQAVPVAFFGGSPHCGDLRNPNPGSLGKVKLNSFPLLSWTAESQGGEGLE